MPNADKFQLHIYAALAEQERDFISLRTKAALAEKKASGVKLGGMRDKTNQRIKAIIEKADKNASLLIGLIEPLVASGKSLREVAGILNQCGYKTASGKCFYAQTVKNIIIRANII